MTDASDFIKGACAAPGGDRTYRDVNPSQISDLTADDRLSIPTDIDRAVAAARAAAQGWAATPPMARWTRSTRMMLDERTRMPTVERPALDTSKVPYQLAQPTGMLADVFIGGALDLDGDERDWVPQSADVSFKPIVLSVSQGFYVNILRVRSSGVLSRHRHSGPVHAITLRGKWHYLEHDWVATAGDYAFEPPGETHTLVVPDDVTEMATLFHVTGGYTYVDPYGKALGYEDVFTKLDNVRRHYASIGLGADYADRFVR